MLNLKYIIENEFFITCSLLPTDSFISYCKDRGIQTSIEQLEQLEKLGIFYPVARVKYPKIKIKVEYIDNSKQYHKLGRLKDEEEWSGDVKEEYANFWFEKDIAKNWFEEGFLWEPSSRPFQQWETFIDENRGRQIESFYSIFQCYTLHFLLEQTTIPIGAESWVSYNKEDVENITNQISKWAKDVISVFQKYGTGTRGKAVSICQIISNRYFPQTQSDHRTIQVPFILPTHPRWDWDEYCRNWDAKEILAEIGLSIDELKQLHENVVINARYVDPLQQWYGLISFISVSQKQKLKGKALFAQTLYSMEHMLRLFYKELTGEKLPLPDEGGVRSDWKDRVYGEGITQNELQYLEFLVNQYHLNPRPKLILVVEGNGEEEQFPRLAEELFGNTFPKLGIEVRNIQGINNFTGPETGSERNKYGALERFIDDHHYRQTFVFVVLDNEDPRATRIKESLIKKPSQSYPKRTVTKAEYINIWNKNIEFDNFRNDEIDLRIKEVIELCLEEEEQCKIKNQMEDLNVYKNRE